MRRPKLIRLLATFVAISALGLTGCSFGADAARRAEVTTDYTEALLEEDGSALDQLGTVDQGEVAAARAAIPERFLYDSAPPQVASESEGPEGEYDVPAIIEGPDSSVIVHCRFSGSSDKVVSVSVEQGP